MRYIFSLSLTFITTLCFAQHKKQLPLPPPRPFTKHELALAEKTKQCFFSNRYTAAQRKHIFPFNKAVNVVLVSFKEDHLIPVKNKSITDSLVLERTTLSVKQTDSLTNILYNIGYTPVRAKYRYLFFDAYQCYEPRNGIVFIDAAGDAFAYIEICFQCHGTRTSSKAVKLGEFCSTKFELLKAFFLQTGITYGTEKISDI